MNKFLLLISFSLLFFSCSNSDNSLYDSSKQSLTSSLKISKEEALSIANKVLKKPNTTRTISTNEIFSYVLSNKKLKTRGISLPDTLAYVINYPNDEGFVMISSDRRVNPVLGFSDEGHFSFDNENAKSNFVDKIAAYMQSASPNLSYNSDGYEMYYQVLPSIKVSLGQYSPWNKYVLKEHSDCPAGCVAIATALVLSHSLLELDYHGSKYYFKSIIEAINKGQNIQSSNNLYYDDEWNNAIQPKYTYEQAVDLMAKFIYWIGKDVGMTYTSSVSSANSMMAYALCKELKDDDNMLYNYFNIDNITWKLSDGYIIYLRGTDLNGKGGHAWVSDGACYCVVTTEDRQSVSTKKIKETYIHCDWGWDGISNGYFSGSVFSAGGYDFEPLDFFALKRGNNDFLPIIH